MDKLASWFPPHKQRQVSIVAMLLGIVLFIYEHYLGNSFTTMTVMLYTLFLFPSVLLTKPVQEKYFLYTREYIIAVRGFTSIMCLVFLSVWLFATCTDFI